MLKSSSQLILRSIWLLRENVCGGWDVQHWNALDINLLFHSCLARTGAQTRHSRTLQFYKGVSAVYIKIFESSMLNQKS